MVQHFGNDINDCRGQLGGGVDQVRATPTTSGGGGVEFGQGGVDFDQVWGELGHIDQYGATLISTDLELDELRPTLLEIRRISPQSPTIARAARMCPSLSAARATKVPEPRKTLAQWRLGVVAG